jgi:hypothetical protein
MLSVRGVFSLWHNTKHKAAIVEMRRLFHNTDMVIPGKPHVFTGQIVSNR